ncbi:MAG: small basic protein [Candidatus Omnitrophica bacterium]|nr:small basic protein [Candidatus Omnitrophota bacterium]
MSIHPSLKIDLAGAQQKTVLSRIQRIKDLFKKGKWQEGQSVTGLPKTKILKVKTKKTKAAKAETPGAPGAPGAAAPAGGASAKAAKK